jgi:nitroreductase
LSKFLTPKPQGKVLPRFHDFVRILTLIMVHADKNWLYGPEDTALALSLLDLYAASLGLGACWAGYVYKTTNAYPPLFEALGLPADHLAFGAMMIGYPKFSYRRIPIRNRPCVTWK